jgi:hypothetical protein
MPTTSVRRSVIPRLQLGRRNPNPELSAIDDLENPHHAAGHDHHFHDGLLRRGGLVNLSFLFPAD